MVEVKNLVKRYGSHLAVDHLSFTLEPGRVYGFLGPNGAGKSTTMNIMTGYLGANEGSVVINGHDILEEPKEAKKYIGFLPELPPLYTDMFVGEYLQFAAELKEIPRKERAAAIAEAMELTGLKDVQKRMIKNLSKGYRQRVGLAQAILGMPEIIILDEPTVGLDPLQIMEIRELITKLSKDHIVILSSHILSEISAVCQYIMIISHGRLVASDSTENLMTRMDAGHKVELLLRGDSTEDMRAALGQVQGVNNLEEAPAEDGFFRAVLSTDGSEIREEIFTICARNNWPIYELAETKASLEDVFRELTSDDEAYRREAEQAQETQESASLEPEEKDSKEEQTDESNL